MRNKIFKISTLILTLSLTLVAVFALTACNGNDATYTYSKVEMSAEGDAASEMQVMLDVINPRLQASYNTLYKDSTITVNNKKLVWKIADETSIMQVKKSGEKYNLSGEATDKIIEAFTTLLGSGSGMTCKMHGIETEEGFNIIMTFTMPEAGDNNSFLITLFFVK